MAATLPPACGWLPWGDTGHLALCAWPSALSTSLETLEVPGPQWGSLADRRTGFSANEVSSGTTGGPQAAGAHPLT